MNPLPRVPLRSVCPVPSPTLCSGGRGQPPKQKLELGSAVGVTVQGWPRVKGRQHVTMEDVSWDIPEMRTALGKSPGSPGPRAAVGCHPDDPLACLLAPSPVLLV